MSDAEPAIPSQSPAAPFPLVLLGATDAAACEGDVCAVPDPADATH